MGRDNEEVALGGERGFLRHSDTLLAKFHNSSTAMAPSMCFYQSCMHFNFC